MYIYYITTLDTTHPRPTIPPPPQPQLMNILFHLYMILETIKDSDQKV